MLTLPIAVEQLHVFAAGEAKPSIDRQTGEQRKDANGTPLHDMPVALIGEGGAISVNVRIPHKLDGVAQGAPLKAYKLKVLHWQNGDRSGLSFRADKIEVINSTPASSQRS